MSSVRRGMRFGFRRDLVILEDDADGGAEDVGERDVPPHDERDPGLFINPHFE